MENISDLKVTIQKAINIAIRQENYIVAQMLNDTLKCVYFSVKVSRLSNDDVIEDLSNKRENGVCLKSGNT